VAGLRLLLLPLAAERFGASVTPVALRREGRQGRRSAVHAPHPLCYKAMSPLPMQRSRRM